MVPPLVWLCCLCVMFGTDAGIALDRQHEVEGSLFFV